MRFPRENRAFRAGAVLLCAAAGLLPAGCGPDGAGARPGGPKPVSVEIHEVTPALLRDVETFGGALQAEFSVMLKPETDGVVASIEFEEGQRVKEGRVLVRLRDAEESARLAEAQANLALAREIEKRTNQLVTRDAASLAQKDQARAELDVAEARVQLARVALERTAIKAPFDGVAGLRLVSPGDRVNDDSPLVQVDSVDRLQLTFPTSEHGVRFARVGAPIQISVGPYPGERFPGEVFFVSPTLDPSTRRVVLKAWVPNDHGKLRAGLFANVELEIDRREGALLVPESAVVYDRKGTYVWKEGGEGKAERVPIEIGLRRRGVVEVTLGLRPGDRIVSAGTHKLSEGDALAVKETPSAGQALRETPADAGGEGT